MGDSMSTIINATTTNGVVIQPDNSGSLVLQTNNGTTALTISTAQDTTLAGKLTSAGALTLASNGTTTALTIDTSQRAAFVAGTAALPAITTTGDTNTGMWFPAADTIAFSEGGAEAMRLDSSGNVSVGTTSSLAKLTVSGNITPSAAPSSFWGLDYAPSSSSGAYVTIANNGTYNFAYGSGATFVYEDSGTTGAVMFMSVYGSTYTVWQSGTGYSNVPTTASKINFGYNSGVGAYYLENKTGSSKNLYISNIKMRSGS